MISISHNNKIYLAEIDTENKGIFKLVLPKFHKIE